MFTLVLEDKNHESNGPICVIYHESNPKLFNQLILDYLTYYEELDIEERDGKSKEEYIAQCLREDGIEFILSYEFNHLHI